ncbi:hypothetical protein Tsubulata_006685 [Turnera subulata]|uniref:Dynein light chain n=1 Tax=Turnera subulata TaxID=218843 RepID=A0A9Q0JRH0_9ROSI|nr:hypothetical protein Tsubulata_006685 [Turnera subulata]
MAHHTNHRRTLASPDPPIPLSMDPTLKRQPKPTSTTHINNYNNNNPPDPIPLSKPSYYMSSKHNSNHKVTSSSLTSQKPIKNPPSACIDTHLQAKGMTLSADFDACRISFIKPKHHHKQQLKPFEPKVAKDIKTNEEYRVRVKKPSSPPELGDEKRVAEVVQESEKKKKEVYGKVEASNKGLKEDPVESMEKKKVEEVQVSEKKKSKEAYAKVKESTNKELKDLFEESLDIKSMTVSFGGGRRRSYCGSQVELADFLANNGAKVVSVDMPPFMQIHAVDCARKACDSLEKFTPKTLALTLKKEFDGVYGPAWHCIVGTSFGSFVTHSVGGFLYFSMDHKLYVLLFKTTVQRAD